MPVISGIGRLNLTNDLVWVVEDLGRIVGACITFAGHGFVMPLAIRIVDDAPNAALLALMRGVAVGSYNRGLRFYLMPVGETDKVDGFIKIFVRNGASIWSTETGCWIGGPLEPLVMRSSKLGNENAA